METQKNLNDKEKQEQSYELREKVVELIYDLPYTEDNQALYELLAVVYNYKK